MRRILQRLRRASSPAAREHPVPPLAHGVVLLATGISIRNGLQADALTSDTGEPLLRQLARGALATGPDALVVSVPADDHTALEVVLRGLPLRCIPVPRGMAQGAALRAALSVLPDSCSGALLLPCDRVRTAAADLARLLEAWRLQPQRAACFAADRGIPGLPALLPQPWWEDLDPDNGLALRTLLQARCGEVSVLEEDALGRPPPDHAVA